MTISSPALTRLRPKLWATRLMPSVVPRVKMISRSWAALRNWRTRSRVLSYAWVARSLRKWTPRWMFEFSER